MDSDKLRAGLLSALPALDADALKELEALALETERIEGRNATQHRPHARHPGRQALAPNPLIFPTFQSNHDSLTPINRSMDAAAARPCHLMCAGRWPRGNQLMETVMIR